MAGALWDLGGSHSDKIHIRNSHCGIKPALRELQVSATYDMSLLASLSLSSANLPDAGGSSLRPVS